MAEIALTTSSTPQTIGPHRVYLKLSLFSDWTEVPALHCDAVSFNAAPSFSTARLYWRYGPGMLPAETTFDVITRQGVNRYYVRIDFSGMTVGGTPLGFFGTVEIDSDRLDGPSAGRQSLECYGIERLLDMQPVRSSWWEDTNEEDTARESGSGFTFNAGGLPNRSAAPIDDAFVFTHDSDAEHWTSRNIAQYLLKRHAAIDFGALVGEIEWVLVDDSLATPTWDKPTLDSHGRTVWEMLNQLYPRQRMLSFITRLADVDEEDSGALGKIEIRPFTFAHEAIDLGDAAGIPANDNLHTLDVDDDHTAAVVVTKSSVDICHRVIVEGAPRTSTCTVETGVQLGDGWTAEIEAEYEAGASDDAGYPASTLPALREFMNIDARNSERYADVYARFVFNEDFLATQKINGDPVFPDDDDETVAHLVSPVGLRILPQLTLLAGHFYEGNAIGEDTVVTFADGPYENRPPLVVTVLPDDPEEDPDVRKWVDVRVVGQAAELELDADDSVRNWSAAVRVPTDGRAIIVEVHGMPQHVIASATFTALSPLADHGERDIARFDYGDFTFTITIEEDRRAMGVWPAGRVIPEIPRVKLIQAGDKYRCDYVVPDTVVDLFPATGVRQKSDGGYVRDDRPLLLKIAKLAFAWYGAERNSVTISSSVIDARLIPGVLLTSVGDRTVNACVTSLSIEIPRASGAQPGVPKATYITSFGELDPLNVFPV